MRRRGFVTVPEILVVIAVATLAAALAFRVVPGAHRKKLSSASVRACKWSAEIGPLDGPATLERRGHKTIVTLKDDPRLIVRDRRPTDSAVLLAKGCVAMLDHCVDVVERYQGELRLAVAWMQAHAAPPECLPLW